MASLDLNQSFLVGLRKNLEGNGFTADDFEFTTKKVYSDLNVQIKYIYNKDYCFKFAINPTGQPQDIELSPGKILSLEKIPGIVKFDDLSFKIAHWLDFIRNEIGNTVVGRHIKDTQEKIAEIEDLIENKFDAASETYFTKAEGKELKDKLEELEEMYFSSIEKSEKIQYEIEAEKTKLHEEIELLKDQVQYLTKKKWATALMVKLVNWAARNPQAAKQIGQSAVKTLLPKEIEDSLPSNFLPPTDEK
ncbi:hypothetical protein [Bacillus atrophaeus]|uniref:hypothetical protein n=1 Tax=Bacillus atrophaeus TaxID=1452 RepID=UPI00227EAFA3|nr:hypothetical protein [Bacillus atrophaeus]MCY8807009.1 hypothetical protein [Bacillus atrophaeus]MCY8824375.1 hypothetical protein [Bacillus atrophaeus]MCY8842573.1 hypothetical protein [Bacillus atrophaeus]MCY8922380.1 hypothetical protein [Bacillus atrophaeus]MEC0804785.1 hypothetical protein [Bacillus atrophaeus]